MTGLAILLALGGAPARAATSLMLDMPAQSLSLTLKRLARAGSVELAFDRAVTDPLRAPRLHGAFTLDKALTMALAGSGLGVDHTPDGAYVIKPVAVRPPAAAPDSGDGAVSELLVMGRRNLNTGIRRTRDDIQPYDVALEDSIRTVGGADIESFMRRAMPADAQAASLAQAPALNSASARSRIDLLGLGADQTLVLVDGRRLPSVPEAVGASAGFVQADVNGVPLDAIERVEVLTAAAGALYGPGATGGVVNIVLKRDYRGAEAKVTQGATQHGGGRATRLDAAVGRSTADGRSGLSVRVGLSDDEGLDVGDRPFGERALVVSGANFRTGDTIKAYVPVGAGVNVASLSGPLTLKPTYGGTALGSAITSFSTAGFTAGQAVANAGQLNLDLPTDAFGAAQSLLTRTLRRSVVVSGRHEAGIVEGFFDYLLLDNEGRARVPAGETTFFVGAQAPFNPFEQQVYVARSVPWNGLVRNRSLTQRADAGLIVRLAGGWMAEGDLSRSQSDVRVTNTGRATSAYADLAAYGADGAGPVLSPFAPEDDFVAAYDAYQLGDGSSLRLSDRLNDANVRVSGPLWRLPGGPLTMTVTAEAASERAPGGERVAFDKVAQAPLSVAGNPLHLTTRSAYAEWRAPLTPADGPGPFRGLELQAALRGDDYRIAAPQSVARIGDAGPPSLQEVVSRHAVVAKTLGVKTFLADGLMLRASYSDGHLPPNSAQIQSLVVSLNGTTYPFADPQRGGQLLGAAGPFRLIQGGSPGLDPELARTFAVGFVLTPPGFGEARLSLDYLRTDKRREITEFASADADYFLAHEAQYTERIVRAPLTDADRAMGFTDGAVTVLDTTALNVGRSIAESVDLSFNDRVHIGDGQLSAYVRATWQPSYRRRADPAAGWIETAGFSDGPLRLRGFAGVQWSRGGWDLGLNAQLYGGYRAATSGFSYVVNSLGSDKPYEGRIPPQAYLDAFARWSIGDGRTQVQLIVHNLFDAQPPLALAAPTGYSTYGDAQGRSAEVSLMRRF